MFILVVDFDSLHPSIIQEYDIDSTTVGLQDSDAFVPSRGLYY